MRKNIWNTYAVILGIAVCTLGMNLITETTAWSCDVAVVSARVTTNNKPFIWKNRDSSAGWREQVKYFSAKKAGPGGYLMVFNLDYYILLNTGSPINPSGGLNEGGFAISCTAVYENSDPYMEALNINTRLMQIALEQCVTLNDFDTLLKSWHTIYKKAIKGNFVAIDAHGGAALYEVYTVSTRQPLKFMKFDANNGSVVNELGTVLDPGQGDQFIGFVNRANSNTYIPNNSGEERRWRATDIMTELVSTSRMNYDTFIKEVAKDVTGIDPNAPEENYNTTYCISRAQTRIGMVVNGVADGDDPRQCVFWCALGEPSAAVFLPFFPGARNVSYLAWVDGIGLDGAWYDHNDACMLNRAFNRREIFEKLMYDSNIGSAVLGMDDKNINKLELYKVQEWTFPLEEFIVEKTEQYLDDLRNNPALMTSDNLRSFSDYCAEYCYENYCAGSVDEVLWDFAMP